MPLQLVQALLRKRTNDFEQLERDHHDPHFLWTLLGCHQTKPHHRHSRRELALWSRIMSLFRTREDDDGAKQADAAGQSTDDAIDPVTGLSRREKDHVQQSWHHVRKDLRAAGLGFFAAFFKAHPEYQQMFKSFTDVPIEQLSESASFRAHAMNVMNAVCLVVDSLDNTETLVRELKRLGKSHGRQGIEHVHFRNLTVVLVAFLGDALGEEIFTVEVRQSWTKALDVVVAVVTTGLDGDK